MSVCSGTKRNGQPCTVVVAQERDYCYHHDPDPEIAARRSRNASRAATLGNSKIGAEIRSTRFLVRDLVEMTLSNELHPLARKRLTEVVQLLQVYARLAELEIASMEAEGKKLPVFKAREVLGMGLPEDTKEKVRDFAQTEQEKAERTKEGERVLREVAALEEQGIDASALRHFIEQ